MSDLTEEQDNVLRDVATLLAGLQVPVSLSMPLGTARMAWTSLHARLKAFGWANPEEYHTALRRLFTKETAESELRDENKALRHRLAIAERVCVLYGWTGQRHETERDKALHEVWSFWHNLPDTDSSPDGNPELTDELISELAAQRDATRARTLERIRREGR